MSEWQGLALSEKDAEGLTVARMSAIKAAMRIVDGSYGPDDALLIAAYTVAFVEGSIRASKAEHRMGTLDDYMAVIRRCVEEIRAADV